MERGDRQFSCLRTPQEAHLRRQEPPEEFQTTSSIGQTPGFHLRYGLGDLPPRPLSKSTLAYSQTNYCAGMQGSIFWKLFPLQMLPFRFAIPPPPSDAVTLQWITGG